MRSQGRDFDFQHERLLAFKQESRAIAQGRLSRRFMRNLSYVNIKVHDEKRL